MPDLRPKRWQIAPRPNPAELSAFSHMHPALAAILIQRGFTTPAEADAFLIGAPPNNDPFKLRGMAAAVGRIRTAIKRREKIIVYGDFDADGVTSTALLVTVLRALGADVDPYIPHRVDEGYGLNDAALIALAKRGVKLVVTVDCGIRSLREVETGMNAGLDMIVTDHHSVGPELPRATAVINPKQPGDTSGDTMLAGVGVTFRLAEALLRVAASQDKRELPIQPDDLLDLVAIGTVADLVPLNRPENRALVVRGLRKIHEAKRLGVRALLDKAGVKPEIVNATAIGFAIGPRINAAGRLESAMQALNLLLTNDISAAAEQAAALNSLNEKRQQLTREMQEYARQVAVIGADTPLIFAANTGFIQGIVGLVAGRLAEEYYRPAVIVHQGEHESHGSCRSIAEFNITEALDQCADLLIRHGGHAQAAGFAIENGNIPAFQARLTEIAAEQLAGKDLQPTLAIDLELSLREVDWTLHEALQDLEPTGNAFPAPVLCARRLQVLDCRAIGKENAHLKIRLGDGGGQRFNAVGWNFGKYADSMPREVDAAFVLLVNEWNGNRNLELEIKDLRPAT